MEEQTQTVASAAGPRERVEGDQMLAPAEIGTTTDLGVVYC